MRNGRPHFPTGSGDARARLLVVAAAAVLLLAAEARALPASDAPHLIGGPVGRLLAGSTDLGPARTGDAQLTVALRDANRPMMLLAWANDHGLSVRWRAGDDWAFVAGSPRDLGSAFGVAVHDYRTPSGRVFYASAVQPMVPAALQAQVSGLGRILSYHRVHVVTPPLLPVEVPAHGLTPTQLVTTYNAAPLATTGKGQTMVFFEIDGYDQFNLGSYSRTFGLSPFTPTLVGGQPAPPLGETEMDLEVAHAIAPDARLVVVNATAGLGLRPGYRLEGVRVGGFPSEVCRACSRRWTVSFPGRSGACRSALTATRKQPSPTFARCGPPWPPPKSMARRRSPPAGTPAAWNAKTKTMTTFRVFPIRPPKTMRASVLSRPCLR